MELMDRYAAEFRNASIHWRTRFDAELAASGQRLSRAMALLYLSESSGKMTQKELGKLLGLEGPTVARLLDGLERQGIITREQGNADRRVNYINLTPKAMPVVDEVTTILKNLRREFLSDIPAEKLKIGIEILQMIGRKKGGNED